MDDVIGKSIRVLFGLVAASAVFFVIIFLAFGGDNPAVNLLDQSVQRAEGGQRSTQDQSGTQGGSNTEHGPTPGTTAAGSRSTSENEPDTWNGEVIDSIPPTFDEATEGKVLVRFFRSLSNGRLTPEGFVPDPDYYEVVEIRREGVSIIPGGMSAFFQKIMINGSWDVAGRAVAGSDRQPARVDQGRILQPREAFLLIHQRNDWYQIKFVGDFVYLQDGRVMINYDTISVPEINLIDKELLPKYHEAYGVSG